MGEAKQKRREQAAAAQKTTTLQPEKLATAVRQVVAAMTDYHGADCLLFAGIGAGALQQLGIDARPVAGSAIWRVGPGDSDTISHAREVQGPLYLQGTPERSLQFHTWVEAPGLLADFSTATLKFKAEQLDAADGGTTNVAWAPDFLWLAGPRPAAMLRTPSEVNQSFAVGVYSYLRHADIEAIVLPDLAAMLKENSTAVSAAVTAYRALCAGHGLQVVGIGDNGTLQTEPQSKELKAVERDSLMAEITRDKKENVAASTGPATTKNEPNTWKPGSERA